MKDSGLVPKWILASVVLSSVLLGLDTIGSSTTSTQLLGTSSVIILSIVIAATSIHRYWRGWSIPPRWLRFIQLLIILTACISVGLVVAEYLTPDNFVYSRLRVNAIVMLTNLHFLIVVYLVGQTNAWWKSMLPRLLMILPLWLLSVSYLVSLLPFDAFASYSQEDGVIENIQVVVLVVTVFVCFRKAAAWFTQSKKLQATFFALLASGFLLLALEEISWGQRIFGWQTPESLAAVNVQNETTIHNIGILNQLQLVGYLLISGAGLLFSASKNMRRWQVRDYFWYPHPGSIVLFSCIFVFYSYFTFFNESVHQWTEMFELLLYVSLFFWILNDKLESVEA
ncbi:MAG: hypothetical protein WDZ94_02420 [Patescibacteria group bacterium]